MSDADKDSSAGFGKLVPGFDFLQNLARQASAGASQGLPQLPKLGSWIAPTLNLEELDKRIEELKAVQFWLDQNAMALKATIQALEVQKMTLATLKGMNFNMGEVANAFKLKETGSDTGAAQKAADKARTFSGLEVPPTSYDKGDKAEKTDKAEKGGKSQAKAATPGAAAATGVVDPMQWWGALTQQFQNIATTALQEAGKQTALGASQETAAGLARDAVKSATDLAQRMAGSAGKAVARSARPARGAAWPTPVAAKKAAPAKTTPKPKPKAKPKAAVRKTARKTSP